ncbi:hypothetical protein D3C76_932060 [compost metagenome]
MSEITRGVIGMPFDMAMGSELSRRQFHGRAQGLQVEFDHLKAENAGLKTGYEAYEQVVQGLRAEVEALRKDAERYWWLRSRLPGSAYRIAGVIYSEGGCGIDAGIDAAVGKGEQS